MKSGRVRNWFEVKVKNYGDTRNKVTRMQRNGNTLVNLVNFRNED